MEKRFGNFNKKAQADFQLILLLVSVFAFSYMIYLSTPVSAVSTNVPTYNSWSGAPTFSAGNELHAGTYTSGSFDIGGKIFSIGQGQTGTITASEEWGLELVIKDSGGNIIEKGGADLISAAGEGATGVAGKPGSKLSNWLGAGGGTGPDALITGLQWAGIAYMAGQLVGGLFGMTDENTDALSYGLGAGFGSYKVLSTWSTTKNMWLGNPLVGAGIGAIVFVVMYKKVDVEVVTFDCLAWQAPTGGDVCEVCNDENLPCSEYRCRALGQNCELVNQGSSEERCVTVRHDDVDPPTIRPNDAELSEGHGYTNVKISPPGPGFNIVNLNSSDGCLKAFTALEFG